MTIKEMAVKYYHLEKLNAEAEFSKAELEKNHHAKQKGLFNKIEELQLGITQSNQIIEKLSVFKSTFGDGQDQSFEDSLQLQKPLEMNPRAFLECNVKQGERLDLQFSEMLDCQLDDFEFQISQLSRKREILALTNSNAVDRENSHKLELREINVSFKKRIDQINEQQRLLQSHMIELKNTLSLKTDDVVSIRPMTEALRKYSTRLLLSKDDGVTFNVFPSTPYCKGCNEKVAMCPHRQTNFTIQIPPSTTHLKLEHAPLKFRTSHLKADFDKIENFDTDGEIIKYEKPFSTLWSDFYEKRGCKKPRLVRIYPLAKLIDYMEEIYDARSLFEETLDEEACTKKGVAVRFIEFFNEFMERRYLVREIAAKPIYDIYMSLIRHSSDSLRVKIFAQTLGGEHDAIWNYLRLISRLISKYEPLDSKQYRNFLTVLYPARTVEMYEQMELEFIAYSKNRFSREFVEDHIMHMLLSEIEPNFTFVLVFNLVFKMFEKGRCTIKGKINI